jgi:hypothetical protein
MLLLQTTLCLLVLRSSKPIRNVIITSRSVLMVADPGQNHSSLPVHSRRSLRPSLSRLKGMRRTPLPRLPNRVESCGIGEAVSRFDVASMHIVMQGFGIVMPGNVH